MSVSTLEAVNIFQGNGSTTVFPTNISIIDDDTMLVTLFESTLDRVGEPQILNVDYTVSGVGTATGASITMVVAPPSGSRLVVERLSSFLQASTYSASRGYDPSGLVGDFDLNSRRDQELAAKLARAALFPKFFNPAQPALPMPQAGMFLVGDPTGTHFVNSEAPGGGSGQAVPATRAAAVIELAAGTWVPTTGAVYFIEGIPYAGLFGSTAIADLPNLIPALFVCSEQFGGRDYTHIVAAFTYHRSITATTYGQDAPAATALEFRFFSGEYNVGGANILYNTNGSNVVIRGEGMATRLRRISFRVQTWNCTIRDLCIDGIDKADDAIVCAPASADPGTGYRFGFVTNVRIINANRGLHFYNDNGWMWFTNVVVYRCTVGMRAERFVGVSFIGCQFTQCTEQGAVVLRGGEWRAVNCRFNNNGKAGLRLDGSTATGIPLVVVEHYIIACSFSNNFTGVLNAQIGNRETYSITGAADNGAGGTRFTVDVSGGRHKLADGLLKVNISGTTSYNGDRSIYNVTDTTFDMLIAFVSSQTGTVRRPEWDVEIVGDKTIRPAQVNDMFFTGCNINYVYMKEVAFITFDSCRLKQQVFLDGDCYGISRRGQGRGRNAYNPEEEVEDETGTWTGIRITGQNYGFVEEISVHGTAWADFSGAICEVPDKDTPLIGNKVQAYFGWTVDEDDGITLKGLKQATGKGGLIQLDGLVTGLAIQSSFNDSTAGKLLRNGSHGLGLVAAAPFTVTDLDTITLPTGYYRVTSAGTLAGTWPPGVSPSSGFLHIDWFTTTGCRQVFTPLTGTNGTWFRIYNGSWGAWQRMSPVLGTVAMLSGVPTGTLFQVSDVSAGEVERRASGWQTCKRTDLTANNMTTAEGSIFRSADITWTFPLAFDAAELPVVEVVSDVSTACGFGIVSISNTAVTFRTKSSTSIAGSTNVRAVAHGRWSI